MDFNRGAAAMYANAIRVVLMTMLIGCVMGCPRGRQCPQTPVRYTVTDLGSFGGDRSNALAVNDMGQVVGLSEMPSGIAQGFLWDAQNGIMSLGSFNQHSEAWDINELGQVVGETYTLGDVIHPFLWSPDAPNGTTGTMYDLATLGGFEAGAWQINDLGQVTGWSDLPTPGVWHPFLWTPDSANGTSGDMADLGTLGGIGAETYAINDMGQTAGYSIEPDQGFTRAVLWTPDTPNGDTGSMVDLYTLGGNDAEVRDINSSGATVGRSWRYVGEIFHAFKWTPLVPNGSLGNMQDLGTLGGDTSYAFGMNGQGQVVGRADRADGSSGAFLWDESWDMVDLTSTLDCRDQFDPDTGKGWDISIARDINSDGWIVGTGTFDGGQPRAVLLRPKN